MLCVYIINFTYMQACIHACMYVLVVSLLECNFQVGTVSLFILVFPALSTMPVAY